MKFWKRGCRMLVVRAHWPQRLRNGGIDEKMLMKWLDGGTAADPGEQGVSAPVPTRASGDDLLVNAYGTVGSLPALSFPHRLMGQRDLADPELAPHLAGFIEYLLSRGDGQMTSRRYHLMRHIERVRHHLSLWLPPSAWAAYAEWAQRANAVAFMPDGTILDPLGYVLFDAGGRTPDADAQLPYPPQAWARKARTEALLARRALRVVHNLPPVISEQELLPRESQEIASRALALMAVAVRAESLATHEPLTPDEIWRRLPTACAALSPVERAFMVEEAPEPQHLMAFGWRYECLAVLLWMLGLLDELPFPSAICDVPRVSRLILDAGDEAGLLAKACLRSPTQLLDELDLQFRLHWLTTQAGVDRAPPPEGVEPDVVMERHHALNWLVRFEGKAWDEVPTPT